MKNKIYNYFFHQFVGYFAVVLFASTAIIWTIQAVNFLDLVTDDGHAFVIYLYYSLLTIPKVLTKLIPLSFLIATILTILKLEKDNELMLLWTSGLNKIYVVHLFLRISFIIMFIQIFMSTFINPETLNISRHLIKNSELQFIPSLLKEKKFNDTVEGLTIFVDKKNPDGTYTGIFVRDDSSVLTEFSTGSSTIFAKQGYISKNEKNLILINGNIQKTTDEGNTSIVKFEKTSLNLSGLSTKTTSDPKIQETSTVNLFNCFDIKNAGIQNCGDPNIFQSDIVIELNRRLGLPFFIPLIAMISCFLLSTRKEGKVYFFNWVYFFIGFIILISSEISVRYSGFSLNHSLIFYLIPIGMLPLIYIMLIRKFKYENLY